MKHAIAALMFLAIASPAGALADPKADAKIHIDKATTLHGEGKFAEALEELKHAYTLDPRPELLYAIGQVHVQLGNCPQAITFYERFLSTKPDAGPAGAAREAIQTCKTAPPDPVVTPTPDPQPTPTPTPTPGPVAEQRPPPRADEPSGPKPWYKDKVGGALVGGGAVLGVVAVISYFGARGKLDDAENAPTFQAHEDLVDDANGQRNLAVGLAVGSVVLIGAGIVRYQLRDNGETRQVAITPTTNGGLVTWMGRF